MNSRPYLPVIRHFVTVPISLIGALLIALPLPILLVFMSDESNLVPIIMATLMLGGVATCIVQKPYVLHLILRAKPMKQLAVFFVFMVWITYVSGLMFMPNGPNPQLSQLLMFFVWLSPGILLMGYLQRAQRFEGVMKMFHVLGVLVVISVAVGYVFNSIQTSSDSGSASRMFGLFGDSVAWALAFFTVYAFAYKRWVLFAAACYGLVATGSIGATITGATAVALYLGLIWRRDQIQGRSIVAVGLAIPIAAYFIDFEALPILLRLNNIDGLNFTLSSRTGAFHTAWNVIYDHLITGVGYSGFGKISSEYSPEQYFDFGFSTNFVSTAQNQYLQTLADGGILGLIMLIFLLFSTAKTLLFVERLELTENKPFFRAAFAWVTSMALTNHSAVWLLPHSIITLLFSLIIGTVTARALHLEIWQKLHAEQRQATSISRAIYPKHAPR